MKQAQALELISPIAPDLIEEADIPLPDKRRLTSRFRAAVIAACLCLALAGTGFAANQVYQLMVRTTADEEDPSYSVQGNVSKYPLQNFSDALLAASEARYGPGAVVQLQFDTFDEVRAFLGEDIPSLWPNGGEGWNGGYSVYLFHTEIDKLWEVEVHSFSFDAQAIITMNIYTEHWRGGQDTSIAGLHTTSDNTIEQLESYLMPNGSTAEIIMETGTGEYPDCHCFGHFISGGILYDVEVVGGLSSQEEILPRLKAILDNFA